MHPHPHPHPSQKIAEAIAYHQARRTSIYNSLYAPALAAIHDTADHPGYEDVILTRECDRSAEIASAPIRKVMADYRCGLAINLGLVIQ